MPKCDRFGVCNPGPDKKKGWSEVANPRPTTLGKKKKCPNVVDLGLATPDQPKNKIK